MPGPSCIPVGGVVADTLRPLGCLWAELEAVPLFCLQGATVLSRFTCPLILTESNNFVFWGRVRSPKLKTSSRDQVGR